MLSSCIKLSLKTNFQLYMFFGFRLPLTAICLKDFLNSIFLKTNNCVACCYARVFVCHTFACVMQARTGHSAASSRLSGEKLPGITTHHS